MSTSQKFKALAEAHCVWPVFSDDLEVTPKEMKFRDLLKLFADSNYRDPSPESFNKVNPMLGMGLPNKHIENVKQGFSAYARKARGRAMQLLHESDPSINVAPLLAYFDGKDPEADPLRAKENALQTQKSSAPGSQYWDFQTPIADLQRQQIELRKSGNKRERMEEAVSGWALSPNGQEYVNAAIQWETENIRFSEHIDALPQIAYYLAHFTEEPPIPKNKKLAKNDEFKQLSAGIDDMLIEGAREKLAALGQANAYMASLPIIKNETAPAYMNELEIKEYDTIRNALQTAQGTMRTLERDAKRAINGLSFHSPD